MPDRVRLTFFTGTKVLGGAEQYLATLLALLPPDEFELSCIAADAGILTALEARVGRADVRFVQFDPGPRPSVWKTVWPLARAVAALRPHIVHCNQVDGYEQSYAILAARVARVPVVLGTFHTNPTPEWVPPYSWRDKLFGWLVDRQLDGAILVCRRSQEGVLRYRFLRPEKLTVIYNGIALPASETARRGDEAGAVIGTVSRLAYGKGVDTFVRTAALLAQQVEGLRFVVVGDGPEKPGLVELARQVGLDGRVEFVGWRHDVFSALRSFDVFVMPSLNESCSRAMLEAMACGVPVVATDVGGVGEHVVAGESGLLVPPGDPDAMAGAVRQLLANPALRDAIGRAGRERAAACYSAERMVDDTCQYYFGLLSHRVRRWAAPSGCDLTPSLPLSEAERGKGDKVKHSG